MGRRDDRNVGHGRQLLYAEQQALKDIFGGGDYGTVEAHGDWWQSFVSGAAPNRPPTSMKRDILIGRA